jgi:hypothetical protein
MLHGTHGPGYAVKVICSIILFSITVVGLRSNGSDYTSIIIQSNNLNCWFRSDGSQQWRSYYVKFVPWNTWRLKLNMVILQCVCLSLVFWLCLLKLSTWLLAFGSSLSWVKRGLRLKHRGHNWQHHA